MEKGLVGSAESRRGEAWGAGGGAACRRRGGRLAVFWGDVISSGKKMEAFEMRRRVLREWKRGGGGESEEKQKTAGLEECGGEGEKPPHVKTNLHNSCSAPFRNSSFIRTGPLDCSNAVCVREGEKECVALKSARSGLFVSCALFFFFFSLRLCFSPRWRAVFLSTKMLHVCVCVCVCVWLCV